jgi:hypothetical protein
MSVNAAAIEGKTDRHTALVYLAEARAKKNDIHPEWRSKLVKWARSRWHEYIKTLKAENAQQELF